MTKFKFLLTLLVLLNVSNLLAITASSPTPEIMQREKHLATQLRCLVCQNQSLADSNADLAGDMRQEIVELMQSGKSDQQVIDILVGRYGDFVLYRPPFKALTFILWLLPILLLLGGGWWLMSLLKQKNQAVTPPLAKEASEQAQQLLKSNAPLADNKD